LGVVEFFIIAVVVVLLGWLAIYAIGTLAPGHPAMIDNIIWFVVVLVIIVMLLQALGLTGYDPRIPRVRG
jgi:hypothetical protein